MECNRKLRNLERFFTVAKMKKRKLDEDRQRLMQKAKENIGVRNYKAKRTG